MPAETEPKDDYPYAWTRTSFDFPDLLSRMQLAAFDYSGHLFYVDSLGSHSGHVLVGQRAGKSLYAQRMIHEHMRRLYGTSYGSSGECQACAFEKPEFRNKKLEEVVEQSKPQCLSQIKETLLPGQVPVLGLPRLPHPWLREPKQHSPLNDVRPSTLKEKAFQVMGDVHCAGFGTFRNGLEKMNSYLRASFLGEDHKSELDELVSKFKEHDGSYKRQKNEARKLA